MALMATTAIIMVQVFISIFIPPFFTMAQTTNNAIAIGATISVSGPPLFSPSGDFAFGFRQNRDNDQNSFLLSIWYDKIPDKTIVWFANSGNQMSRASTVKLTTDQGLVLSPDQHRQEVRVTKWNPTRAVSRAVLNDTGNLILMGADSGVIWQSFDSPTDTLLPGQNMEIGGLLSSKRSETNFTTGKFQMRFQDDGNLVLQTINLPSDYANNPYYRSFTSSPTNDLSSSGLRVVFNETGYMYVLLRNGTTSPISSYPSASTDDFYFRCTLNYDGVLTQYKHKKVSSGSTTETWSDLWSLPENICLATTAMKGSGVCGYNSICSLNAEKKQRPTCSCPPGYDWLDQSDEFGDCQPHFRLSCLAEDQPYYVMNELKNVDSPEFDYLVLPSVTNDMCKDACLRDCLCGASVSNGSVCYMKKLPLSNGRNHSIGLTTYVKSGKLQNSTRARTKSWPSTTPDKLNLAAPVILTLVTGFLVAVICRGKRKRARTQTNVVDLDCSLRCFTNKELSEATDGFRDELGRGGYGTVYKGKLLLNDKEEPIAVKKLVPLMENVENDFKSELNVIGRTCHRNLVRLLGFCEEGSNRMLVYECLENGTLAKFLSSAAGKESWTQRIQIAFDVARGLAYLHDECSTRIIHCDIKPENILLDNDYKARIADFGLAKLLLLDQSHTALSRVRGTPRYLAPEYLPDNWVSNMGPNITVKLDVYSFGVVLLEIITCKRHMNAIMLEERYRNGTLAVFLVDNDALSDMTTVERFVKVALWCTQKNPALRPAMKKVTQMLEGVLHVDAPPDQEGLDRSATNARTFCTV